MARMLLAQSGRLAGTVALLCIPGWAQVTQRVSVDSAGGQGNGESGYGWNGADRGVSISADGRFVAFESVATNLVPGDGNGTRDIFVRDCQGGTIERVSVDSSGVEGNDISTSPRISVDGRYVSFDSFATNLVPGDTNGCVDVFVHDRQLGTTERVSMNSSGTQGDWNSFTSSISTDGRYVTFRSVASNLVPGDTNNLEDVFVRDRQNGTTERVSLDSGGGRQITSASTLRSALMAVTLHS